jgi:hypothetical protein
MASMESQAGTFVARTECALCGGPAAGAQAGEPASPDALFRKKEMSMKPVLAAIAIGAFLAIAAAMIAVNVVAIAIW